MPNKQEIEIRTKQMMVDGYQNAIEFAYQNQVSPEDFAIWARDALLSMFLGTETLRDEDLSFNQRMGRLHNNLAAFSAAGRALFEKQLTIEGNEARESRPLRSVKKEESEIDRGDHGKER